jgi:cycloeucalenol cycloisomerase
VIRYIDNTYKPDFARTVHKVLAVFTMSYFTAFMESLTISHFPYYSFEDRESVYVVGSLFYAIYFFFSFPMFYYFSERKRGKGEGSGVWDAIVNSTSCGMMVLICLDLCRIALKVKFEMKL